MQRSATTPDDFLASLQEPVRTEMATLDREITALMAGEERVLWEGTFWGGSAQRIIGYGTYRGRGRDGASVDWFVVGLAAQKAYLSLYINAAEDGDYLVRRRAAELGKVKVGAANVQFRRLADLDLEVLRAIIARARQLSSDEP